MGGTDLHLEWLLPFTTGGFLTTYVHVVYRWLHRSKCFKMEAHELADVVEKSQSACCNEGGTTTSTVLLLTWDFWWWFKFAMLLGFLWTLALDALVSCFLWRYLASNPVDRPAIVAFNYGAENEKAAVARAQMDFVRRRQAAIAPA